MSLIKLNFIPKTKINYTYRITIMEFIKFLNRCEEDEINLEIYALNKHHYIIDVSNNTAEKQWKRIEHQRCFSIMDPWDYDIEIHEDAMNKLKLDFLPDD